MSNRTLIEFNHDFAGEIASNKIGFADAMMDYLRHATPENASELRRYGVRRFGFRHHSEGFAIEYGSYCSTEPASKK